MTEKDKLEPSVPSDSEQNSQPVVHPGPSKDIWDEALKRSGIDPSGISEYNLPEETK